MIDIITVNTAQILEMSAFKIKAEKKNAISKKILPQLGMCITSIYLWNFRSVHALRERMSFIAFPFP